jgi:hypothetical protein
MIHDETDFACTSRHLAHAGIPCDQSWHHQSSKCAISTRITSSAFVVL